MACYAAGFLVAFAALLALPLQAQAQTVVTLVNSLSQTEGQSSTVLGNNWEVAQGFTTGSNAGGYTLTNIRSVFPSILNNTPSLTVTLHKDAPTNAAIATLTNPATIEVGQLTFTAPANTTLDASTTYYVLFHGENIWLESTTSDNEDSNGLSDWSVEDVRYRRDDRTTGAFTEVAVSTPIRVRGTVDVASTDATLSDLELEDNTGTAITLTPTFVSATTSYTASEANSVDEITIVPTVNDSNAEYEIQDGTGTALTDADAMEADFQVALSEGANTIKVQVTAEDDATTETYQVTVTRATAQTATTFVSNTGQSEDASALGINSFDQGQGFTTGADAAGYVLASVDIKLESSKNSESTGSQIPTVTIVQGTPTGTVVATLMNPASLAANTTADYTFTAPANTTLIASTTYYVVMEASIAGISTARTTLDVEDSGGESDWSIADVSNWRSASSNGSFSTNANALMIKVKGPGGTTTSPAMGQPAITGAAQVGKTLTAGIGTIADTDGLPGTFPDDYTLQWRRVDADGVSNEVDISGETSGTYTPVAADVGKKIKVQVSFTDGGSNAEGPLTSAAYPSNAPVAAAAGACPADNDWCTTLTVGFSEDGIFKYYGFSTAITDDGLADTTIDDGDGTTWTVSTMVIADAIINDQVHINLDAFLARGSVFDLGGTTFTTDETSESTVTTGNYSWLLPAGFAWVHGQDVTVSVKLPANAPATGAPEISGSPQVGATLSAGTTGIMDLDGLTSVSYTYQWIRVDVDGTSNPVDVGTDDEEYTLVAADEGKRIKVQVTFTDDDSNAEELTSDAYLTPSHHSYPDRGIMPALSACPASTTWCATMNVGFQLPGTDNTEFGFSASPGYGALDDTSFDYDGSTFTVENVGIRNPDGMSGYHVRLDLDAFVPRGAVFDLNGYTFTADAAAEQTSTGRYRWALPAGFRIAEGVDYRVSLQVTENTPAEGKPTISGPAQVGRTLTAATADITDDEGLTSVSYTYQWIAAGTVIAGATSVTYTPTSSEQGDKIAVRVTFDDDEDNPETLTSDETNPVAPAAATCPTDAATIWCTTLTVGHYLEEVDGDIRSGRGGIRHRLQQHSLRQPRRRHLPTPRRRLHGHAVGRRWHPGPVFRDDAEPAGRRSRADGACAEIRWRTGYAAGRRRVPVSTTGFSRAHSIPPHRAGIPCPTRP